MYQLTRSFYRANLEMKTPARLKAGALSVNGVPVYDCVTLVLTHVKKPENKKVISRGKITDDLVVQISLLINIAVTHTVLYFTACNQDSQRGGDSSTWLGVMEITPGQSFPFGAGHSTEEDHRFK